jgi:hypothetical protein
MYLFNPLKPEAHQNYVEEYSASISKKIQRFSITKIN